MNWLIAAGAVLAWLILRARAGAVTLPDLPGLSASDATANGGRVLGGLSVGGDSMKATVSQWADAIQGFEGWTAGSVSQRNNNPGNLRVPGDLGTDARGFGVFSSYDLGRAALLADLTAKVRKYPDQTLAQVMARYAPASDGNDPTHYASVIAQKLGVSIDNTLSAIFKG